MMFLYLDTSALVKRCVAEEGSEDVIALMNDTPAAGTALITQTEIAAALVRARREGRLTRDEARQAHGEFLQEWQDLGRVPITNALLTRADTLAWNSRRHVGRVGVVGVSSSKLTQSASNRWWGRCPRA